MQNRYYGGKIQTRRLLIDLFFPLGGGVLAAALKQLLLAPSAGRLFACALLPTRIVP